MTMKPDAAERLVSELNCYGPRQPEVNHALLKVVAERDALWEENQRRASLIVQLDGERDALTAQVATLRKALTNIVLSRAGVIPASADGWDACGTLAGYELRAARAALAATAPVPHPPAPEEPL